MRLIANPRLAHPSLHLQKDNLSSQNKLCFWDYVYNWTTDVNLCSLRIEDRGQSLLHHQTSQNQSSSALTWVQQQTTLTMLTSITPLCEAAWLWHIFTDLGDSKMKTAVFLKRSPPHYVQSDGQRLCGLRVTTRFHQLTRCPSPIVHRGYLYWWGLVFQKAHPFLWHLLPFSNRDFGASLWSNTNGSDSGKLRTMTTSRVLRRGPSRG